MKITDHLLKISGVEYETNSNCYALVYEGGIALIDCGYEAKQWKTMCTVLDQWGFSIQDVTYVFLTHAHFDHGGNARRVNELGARLLTSRSDVRLIEEGNPESERLFGSSWIPAKVDQVLQDGDRFSFSGGSSVTVLATPGHSAGSLSFLIETDGIRALCTGDMFWTVPKPPQDAVSIELGFMGSEDFSLKDFTQSLQKLTAVPCDILLPGHYYFYRGAHVHEVIQQAYQTAINIGR